MNKINNICLAITLIATVAFVLVGNIYLAVINYRIQGIDQSSLGGQLEVYQVVNDIPFEQPESLALAIHIMTTVLLVVGIVWFLTIRFARVTLPKPFN